MGYNSRQNKMKKSLLWLMCAVFALSFASCNNEEVESSSLVGEWQFVSATWYEEYRGETYWESESMNNSYLKLNKDKTMYMSLEGEVWSGTWTTISNTLVIMDSDGDNISFKIKSQKGKELILEVDDGDDEWIEYTLTKIK